MINEVIEKTKMAILAGQKQVKSMESDLTNAQEQSLYWENRVKILADDINIHALELELMQKTLSILESR